MEFANTAIRGLVQFCGPVHRDARGFFSRTFDAATAREAGIDPNAFVQDSLSRSAQGVVRGLHLRVGLGEGKLVRCSSGAVFDVVVDLRPTSPTYRTWVSFDLDGEAQNSIYIPPGCARVPGADRAGRHVVPHQPSPRPLRGPDDRPRRPRARHPLATAGDAHVGRGPQRQAPVGSR